MSNKIKKRKHNPDRRAQRFFSNTRLWSWESTVSSEGYRISHGEVKCGFLWKQLTQKDVNFLITKNNNWAVCCRAVCKSGADVWVETSLRSARDLKINELADVYDTLRLEVLEAVQSRHIIDIGWIVQSFHKKDRIDDGFELVELGELTEERREHWLKSNETYHERRAQQEQAA